MARTQKTRPSRVGLLSICPEHATEIDLVACSLTHCFHSIAHFIGQLIEHVLLR